VALQRWIYAVLFFNMSVVVGLCNATQHNGATVSLIPGTVVVAGSMTGILGEPTPTGHFVHDPANPLEKVDVPYGQLDLAWVQPLCVRFEDKERKVPDSSHVKPNRQWWAGVTADVGRGLGEHTKEPALHLLSLIQMEKLVLTYGVLATDRLTGKGAGCPMRLNGGGFVFSAGRRIYFQFRLEDKANEQLAYHFHGVVVGDTVEEVGWQRFDDAAAAAGPGSGMKLMSVAQFTADATALRLDRLKHAINMRGVWD
jgi:hypothetical protein